MDRIIIFLTSVIVFIGIALYFIFTGTETNYVPITSEIQGKSLECIPTDEDKINACLSIFHCLPNEPCEKAEINGIKIKDVCSDPNETRIIKSNGCIQVPKFDTIVCGNDAFSCPDIEN